MSFNLMAAVTIYSDFGAPQKKSDTVDTVSTLSPSISHEVMGPDAMIFVFLNVELYANFFTLLFSLSSRGSLVLLHFLP